MIKHGTVPKKDTTRQTLEFGAAVLKQLPHLAPEDMQYWIKNQGKLQEALVKALGIPDPRLEWQRFYEEVFGIKADFSKIVLPEKQEGFNWLVVVLEGMTANRTYDKCKERFSSWRYTENLDTIKSVRTSEKTYAIWLRDRVEADEENKNLSAEECEKRGINGITLEERLLLELFYHWRTSKHLDINNVTLCTGSRDSDGDVPVVDWRDDEMEVSYDSPGCAFDRLRARAVS
ncbi:hypothetical protein JW977_00920 [Candidatus Falkowbacteria bacterium]|nr:hypothetical protein [Candidatus Falkowbacteria bacterium]